jgi:hypothetical protein
MRGVAIVSAVIVGFVAGAIVGGIIGLAIPNSVLPPGVLTGPLGLVGGVALPVLVARLIPRRT